MKTVLGIDPGSHYTGFGVIRTDGKRVQHVSHGVIALPSKLDFKARIGIIAEEMEALLERVHPDVTVIERVFLGKNADSAFKLGHARGVAMAMAVRAQSEVVEYAARAVKKGITGSGAASKEQVQLVLFAALGIRTKARADASDALALAFHHARTMEIQEQLERSSHRSSARSSRSVARSQKGSKLPGEAEA